VPLELAPASYQDGMGIRNYLCASHYPRNSATNLAHSAFFV